MIREINISRPDKKEMIEALKKIKYSFNKPFIFFIYINILLYFLYFFKIIFF